MNILKVYSNNYLILIAIILFSACKNNSSQKLKTDDNHIEYIAKQNSIEKVLEDLKKYKIHFESNYFKTPGIIKNATQIINSELKLKIQLPLPSNENWDFPFMWAPGFPVQALQICLVDIGKFKGYIVAFQHSSSATYSYENYLFIYDENGEIIDLKILPDFIYGTGDASVIMNSNFVKYFGSAGYSEIKINEKEIFCNNSILKIYKNGTEEVQNTKTEYEIDSIGKIKIVSNKSSNFYFFKDGKTNTKKITAIKNFH